MKKKGIDNILEGVVVFKKENFEPKDQSLESRSYKFNNQNKMFEPYVFSRSLFAESLDGKDKIRVDWYLWEWKVDYCYLVEKKNKD